MKIRRALQSDKKDLVRLILEFYNFTQNKLSKIQSKFREQKDPNSYALDKARKLVSNPENIVFVAEDKGVLRGFIYGKIKMKTYRVYSKEGYVVNWFVEESSHGKGIGKQLFKKLEKEFKNEGCTHMGLDTHLENKKAIEIYEHLGFKKRLVTFFKILN